MIVMSNIDLIEDLHIELRKRAVRTTHCEIDVYLKLNNINSLTDIYKKYKVNPYNNLSRDFIKYKLEGS